MHVYVIHSHYISTYTSKSWLQECSRYLGPNGIGAVQISPVTEHILGSEAWEKMAEHWEFGKENTGKLWEKLVSTAI